MKVGSQNQTVPEATVQAAALTEQPVAEAGNGRTFVVYFDLGEEGVNGEGMQELAEVSAYADNLTSAHITIAGHTDRSGDPIFNQYLAEVRAKSVVNALTSTYGMAGHTIEVVNRGAEDPAIDDGREYQPQNRRVEIVVQPSGQSDRRLDAAGPDNSAAPAWEKRASI